MNTDGIVEDCDHSTGLWAGVLGASVGDVYVYPSRGYLKRQTGPKVGHVGLIVRTPKSGPRVIHCSSGNARQFGHAIKETDGTIFLRAAGVITARYAGLL